VWESVGASKTDLNGASRMEASIHPIETCVWVGSPEASGLDVNIMPHHVTIVGVSMAPSQSDVLWSSLGFACEAAFKSILKQVDLVITFLSAETSSHEVIRQVAGILEYACGMDVIVNVSHRGIREHT
jgi:hypothetical protein